MKLVRDGDGQVQWGKIVVMLALTVVSGYLASQSQRAGARPDLVKQAKMRAYLTVEKAARVQAAAWKRVEGFAHTAYEIERL
jgi:hypothetical protein